LEHFNLEEKAELQTHGYVKCERALHVEKSHISLVVFLMDKIYIK
jgi:hypothetical protein